MLRIWICVGLVTMKLGWLIVDFDWQNSICVATWIATKHVPTFNIFCNSILMSYGVAIYTKCSFMHFWYDVVRKHFLGMHHYQNGAVSTVKNLYNFEILSEKQFMKEFPEMIESSLTAYYTTFIAMSWIEFV